MADTVLAHSCLERSGVVICGNQKKPNAHSKEFTWMKGPVTQEELDSVDGKHDLRECHLCGRRFLKRCNFEDDFS